MWKTTKSRLRLILCVMLLLPGSVPVQAVYGNVVYGTAIAPDDTILALFFPPLSVTEGYVLVLPADSPKRFWRGTTLGSPPPDEDYLIDHGFTMSQTWSRRFDILRRPLGERGNFAFTGLVGGEYWICLADDPYKGEWQVYGCGYTYVHVPGRLSVGDGPGRVVVRWSR